MKSTKPRTASSLGMFDLFKGLGIATVVFVHTAELYALNTSGGISISTFLIFIYREALMSAFYIASGYGFRKRSIGKCIHQQLKGVLPPYLYAVAATAVIHLAFHYACFGIWENSVAETGKVLGGMLLGLPHTAEYFGITFFSCGPMWYLLAMAVGWIILDILMNTFPERYIPYAVVFTMVLGWATCLVWELPFCLSQGMTVVPYLYIGYLAKKRHWFDQPLSFKFKGLVLLCALLAAGGALATQSTDNMSMGEWTLGPVGILCNGVIGFWAVHWFVGLSRKCEGSLTHTLENVGRRSLQIFCVHTVELTAVPWYLFAAQFAATPLLGLLLHFALRCWLILIVCLFLVNRRRIFRLRPRRSARTAPTATATTTAPFTRYASRHG